MASIPTTVIYGPKGKLTVNTCDVPAWKAKGYSTTPVEAKPVDPTPPERTTRGK